MAIARAENFAREHGIRWRLRPFVLGALMQELGRRAIAQNERTREYAILDVARCAHRIGLRMDGPPVHPFLSLPALRTHALHQDHPQSLQLARELFAAAWERNQDLTDYEVLQACLRTVDLEDDDLKARIRSPEIKSLLRENTDEALRLGVFGAPFFFHAGEGFWGHDRMELLGERLGGAPGLPREDRQRLRNLAHPGGEA